MHKISMVIPAYNEQEILQSSVDGLFSWLNEQRTIEAEVLIVENGSTDDIPTIAKRLAKKYPVIKLIHLDEPSFGKAVQTGLLAATYPETILLNADWIDTDFILLALRELEVNDIVVGSKVLDPNSDRRPLTRKVLSRLLTFVIKRLFNFRGSDSHGLKAFRTSVAQKLVADCQSHEIIETELLIKAQWSGYLTIEIPVGIEEIRPPRQGVSGRIFVMALELHRMRRRFKKIQREAKQEHAAL